MFVTPGGTPPLGYTLTRDAAKSIASNWWRLLVSGLLLIVAGVLIFSIDWSVRSLATFLGAVFILEGLVYALTTGIDSRVRQGNVITGLLSIATGILIIVWPSPGIVAVAIILGAWLIVGGTVTLAAAFAARQVVKQWWLFALLGLIEIALGVLALADPGATLAALITVGGIFAVVAGVMRIVASFEIKRLPQDVDKAFDVPKNGTGGHSAASERFAPAS